MRASWLLNQHGEVGDHLAQIYEKRGEKEQAERMYAEAIAAAHSVPETRTRLIVLLGGDARIDDLVAKNKPELVKVRIFQAELLGNNAPAPISSSCSQPAQKIPKSNLYNSSAGARTCAPLPKNFAPWISAPCFPTPRRQNSSAAARSRAQPPPATAPSR